MSPFRRSLWIAILILLILVGIGSVTYNHTAGYVWPGVGSLSIGSGWSSLNFYLENATRAKLYDSGFDIEIGKKIHGASSYDGTIITESSKPPPHWTSFFTKLPGLDIQSEEITFGIPYFWLIVIWTILGVWQGHHWKTIYSQEHNAEQGAAPNPRPPGRSDED